MMDESVILLWEDYLKKNKFFIEGDWTINYLQGISYTDKDIETYFLDNIYSLYYRNVFLTFVIRNKFSMKYPELEDTNDEGTFQDGHYYTLLFQPYFSIFQQYINIKGNL